MYSKKLFDSEISLLLVRTNALTLMPSGASSHAKVFMSIIIADRATLNDGSVSRGLDVRSIVMLPLLSKTLLVLVTFLWIFLMRSASAFSSAKEITWAV